MAKVGLDTLSVTPAREFDELFLFDSVTCLTPIARIRHMAYQ